MTVGENIHRYRKNLGMSQEELGQELLVSRQTISLWEKDQTTPTIDNLMRLKEVFGVSVDEILGTENNAQITEIEPNEVYKFSYSSTELNEVFGLMKKSVIIRAVAFVFVAAVIIILLIASSAPDIITGLVGGMLFFSSFYQFKIIREYCKTMKKNFSKVRESDYEYKIYDNYMVIRVYRKDKKVRELKYCFSEIEQIQMLDKWLILQCDSQAFLIRKSELKGNSFFFSYIQNNSVKATEYRAPDKLRILSIVLFVASLLSIFGALALISAVSDKNSPFVEKTWVFFLMTPIPIASAVLGFVLKSKGRKYKKNIIVGIIVTALLCLYGSFSFIFANEYDHGDWPVVKTEQITGIDIPEYTQINTQDWTNGTQSISRGYIYYISNIYFDNDAVEDFEKQIATDDKWLSAIPNDLIGITAPFGDNNFYYYKLIYNTDTSEYNTLPDKSGKFHFISILYQATYNQMEIIEYDIDYIKSES